MMLEKFLQHHVLANLTFILVLSMGLISYLSLPREKDPTINFNWIQISTVLPGASPADVEKRITEPLEEGIARVGDIRFISSSSRESFSSILVRFEELDERLFDKRIADLRREVQQIENTRLPAEAESPLILELTSSSAFPTATLVLQGKAYDDNLRFYTQALEKEMERLSSIQRVDIIGISDPELIIAINTEKITGLGISPSVVAQTIRDQYLDMAAGTVDIDDQQWLIRVNGTSSDADYLAALPIQGVEHQVLLGDVAEVYWGQDKLDLKARFNNQPAVIFSVFKKDKVNTLDMIENLKQFISEKNELSDITGITITLLDDNTLLTKKALKIMQTNALIGLSLVLLVTWIFLGSRIAFFTTIGIPFTLSGTFWILHSFGYTLNNAVLLGIVISLGMLVDDAIVVVEAMYTRLKQGMNATRAAIVSLREVFAPVTASVLTTMAAFLPLLLLPGILGQFMFMIPFVVTVALAISLIEAYWMLPAHIIASKPDYLHASKLQHYRNRLTHALQIGYVKSLTASLRRPKIILLLLGLMFIASSYALLSGKIRINFFAGEPFPVMYVNLKMQEGTPIDYTLDKVQQLETRIKNRLQRQDYREIASYAGIYFTETEPLFGTHYAQVLLTLPETMQLPLEEVHQQIRLSFKEMVGVEHLSILQLEDKPPVSRAISIKVQGAEFEQIQAARIDIQQLLEEIPEIENITRVDSAGSRELSLTLNQDAVHRSGLSPAQIMRDIRILVEGEVVTTLQHKGEEVNIRVKGKVFRGQDIESLLLTPIAFYDQQQQQVLSTPLSELVSADFTLARSHIRHYNLKRVVLIEADIKPDGRNTLQINQLIQTQWKKLRIHHPGVSLNFSGELDDIQETLDVMPYLGLMGIGIIYLIIGTQFRSYFQPLFILATIPLAFTGVIAGLFISNNPLSLYTLYGIVALIGIAVNASIVLISAANDRLKQGMSVNHAIVFAARRRFIPILITSLTTIAGLFSLAMGIAGKSLIWGPLATAIVWGLAFSSMLTLFVIPLLYKTFMKNSHLVHKK